MLYKNICLVTKNAMHQSNVSSMMRLAVFVEAKVCFYIENRLWYELL